MSTNLSLRSIVDANKLTGPNFTAWLRNLKFVLRQEKKLYVLDTELPPEPAQDAANEDWVYYQRHIDDNVQVTCVMLASMSLELQKQHENMNAREMLLHLQELFGAHSRVERFEAARALFQCRMAPGSSVQLHVLRMIGYIEKLGQLGYDLDLESSIDLTAEECLKKDSSYILVVGSSSSKHKGKTLKKKKKNKNQKTSVEVEKPENGVKNKNVKGTCFHCGEAGHWKRNCKAYLASLEEKKLSVTDKNKELILMKLFRQ
ncbi:hypothetical protein K2173_023328 [Erythroxylum novogranatense]|uniref:CCHC-type domain-containing protein n=1 Tax=Erythroxylum novogranatense TaxID=1862640 RepID=A0AAV8TZ89_9ROSI|nr:hypothetical protein K2173_023328 [Erythroxylum novogranatense]